MQGTILGALLVLSDRPWYASHTRAPSGTRLSPLQDQHIAGLIMWIPAGTVYLAAVLALVATWVMPTPRTPNPSAAHPAP
jgi:cytochrome c oxidase assembly factor CtaG